MNRRHSCSLLGPRQLSAGQGAHEPTTAGIIGGIEAQEALKLLHGFLRLAAGRRFCLQRAEQ